MKASERILKHPKHESFPEALGYPRGFEVPVVGLLRAWLTYADVHRAKYESGIGEDGVLGPAWASIGNNLLALLNGDCGRLDCGAVDAVIRTGLKAEGFDPDNL